MSPEFGKKSKAMLVPRRDGVLIRRHWCAIVHN